MRATNFLRGMTLLVISVGVLLFMGSARAFAQTENVLYSFQGGNDGINPSTGLIADSAGNLFGTTSDGGSMGCGVVYKLKPSQRGGWTERVIYTFQFAAPMVPPPTPA
jgi:uncharacterized repeat protein (TIGR03803 family)